METRDQAERSSGVAPGDGAPRPAPPSDGLGTLIGAKTVSESVADQLRSEIYRAVLAPGTRLLQAEVAERLGVSTTPVREALSALQGEGLIVIDRHRGAVVFRPTIEDFRECFEIRQLLEPFAVSKAVPNLTEWELDELQGLITEMEEVRDSERYVELNNQFHLRLYEVSRLPRLCSIIAAIRNASAAYLHMFAKARLETLELLGGDPENDHQKMLDACRAGDIDAAAAATRTHLWRPVHDILEGPKSPDLSMVNELLRANDDRYATAAEGDGDRDRT